MGYHTNSYINRTSNVHSTSNIISLIIAYTPARPFRASLAAFRFLVLSKLSNSLTRGKGLDELEELDELDELEELDELPSVAPQGQPNPTRGKAEELDELLEGSPEEEVEGPKRFIVGV